MTCDAITLLKMLMHAFDHHYVTVAAWGWSYGGYVAAALLAHETTIINCSIAVAPITNWLYVDSFTAERYTSTIRARNVQRVLLLGTSDCRGHLATSFDTRKLICRTKRSNSKTNSCLSCTALLTVFHNSTQFYSTILNYTQLYSILFNSPHSLIAFNSFHLPDAVHLQHSFTFMKSLNDQGVIYRSQLYPDSNHFLDDVKYHFYRKSLLEQTRSVLNCSTPGSMELYLLQCFNLVEGQDIIEMQTSKKSAH